MGTLEQQEFQQRIGKIETLIHGIEEITDPATQANMRELVQVLLELHGTGLERMLDITFQAGAAGQAIIDDLAGDDLVASLLLLHGLHPLDLETRVMQALDKVRPYLGSHGGNVELLGVTDEGVVRLRLEGSCHGCPSSRVTLKYAIEDAIYTAAPDVTAIETEGTVESPPVPAGFVPMSQLLGQDNHAHSNGNGWIEVDGLAGLHEGTVRIIDVNGLPLLFCRVGDTFYAYSSTCIHCGEQLGQAKLAGVELVCAHCAHRYDLMRAGRDPDEPSRHLEPFPLLAENGPVKVALHHK
jgi:Fe-S cluster biogenesis protein NfuA/nitrite reductase/ring-hydroxylating ferredoxin subunit